MFNKCKQTIIDSINLNKAYFDAQVRGLDFDDPNASDIINEWVDVSTESKIEEIVPKEIDPLTVMYLINAIYFKGS